MKKLVITDAEPCGYHVLVELQELYEQNEKGEALSDGGIILGAPGNATAALKFEQDGVSVGKVLKVGKWAHKNLSCGANGHKDWGYDIGDTVSFKKHMGQKISDKPSDMRRLLVDHEIMMKVEIGDSNE
jgi:hypothetical protein